MPKQRPKPKFDETDRAKVIAEVEKHFETRLTPIGAYRKFLEDGSGRSYLIFGGYDHWHGITSDMLKEGEKRATGGVLVIAKRHKLTIDVFVGPLEPLISHSRDLSHTQKGDYQFNIEVRGDMMLIKEVPLLTLRKLGAAHEAGPPVSREQRALEAMLAKMPTEERKRFLLQHIGEIQS